ncbi:hypothetical protein [Dankookia sp. P2]|uniref:hypothetical protein n=1 Tax=Dankookia sp. P2 TaxID=3423955 RepID=UPI003D67870F
MVSKPYMCCGGTVARMVTGAPSAARSPKRSAAAPAAATSAPQGFGCAVGSAVEPEVKPTATIRSSGIAGIAGTGPAAASPSPSWITGMGSAPSSVPSART